MIDNKIRKERRISSHVSDVDRSDEKSELSDEDHSIYESNICDREKRHPTVIDEEGIKVMSPPSNRPDPPCREDYNQNSIHGRNDSNKPTRPAPTKDISHKYPDPKSVIYPNGILDENVEDRICSIFASLSEIQATLAMEGRMSTDDKWEKIEGAGEECQL
eukprot:CCRYP_018556-RA/>CCRYP_018556-RA protein AED:0.25 eAED:0.25 QI:58/1/1/1/1/1/2/173/160